MSHMWKQFKPKTRKRYKALRRIIKRLDLPECYIYIPGVQRATETSPECVYLEVRKEITPSHWRVKTQRFYSMPNKREVEQLINHMTSAWSKQ